jgi:DNA-binding beta-propeller fold protein YncE
MYRTENAGDDWIDISEGLPSRFGFPLAVHPHDGDTIYVVPEESDQVRVTPDGAFRVYRSKNRGNTWQALTDGLPQFGAYQNVLRAAMTTDPLDPPGVYVGTQGGHIVGSRDAGDHWSVLVNWLPPVYALETALVDRPG